MTAAVEVSEMPYKDADRQRGYKREWARMQRTGECGTPGGTPLPVAFRLKTAQDVLTLLEEQVQAVRNAREASTLEKARTIGYLAGVALRAIEAGDVAARLEALATTRATPRMDMYLAL
jgi:hypothetical protein